MSAIDPGVEDGIKDSANDIEGEKGEQDYQQEEEDDFRQPSQWWFASTACPLLAGTFGPMASGFNICALVYPWREYVPPQTPERLGKKMTDPHWLVAVNAISLVLALIANASLLLNMARRIKFSIAQPITITGFFLASILLIADMAALGSPPHYLITETKAIPDARHALTGAFYYAIFAACIYIIIGLLMCLTVYGANKGHYPREFRLTSSQRTLMLQTMAFIAYLLLGALVYCKIEGWEYLDAVYWADVTLLTVGLGDLSPYNKVGRGLLFPFAIGGILIVGLVVGSIRSLILERGKEKLSARIVETRRSKAVHNVDERKQTIKISMFASANFSTDPELSPAQRREEEFNVMRKVQAASERERRWFALATSSAFTAVLWFVGAAVFHQTEYPQKWTYFESLYFSYTSLLTIGYGDFSPSSNSGRAFFVLWSLLAVPSLTILISNMGDTIVKWVTDATNFIGSVTVLPGEGGVRASIRQILENLTSWFRDSIQNFTGPGIFGAAPITHEKRMDRTKYDNEMLDRLSERLVSHVSKKGALGKGMEGNSNVDELENDIQFYHYVLARECRNVQKDLNVSPPKNYSWADWEYFLKLMGNEDDPVDFPGQKQPDIMVPGPLRMPDSTGSDATMTHESFGAEKNEKSAQHATTDGAKDGAHQESERPYSSDEDAKLASVDGNVDRQTSLSQHNDGRKHRRDRRPKHPDADPDDLSDWSWLSDESPLMSSKSEPEWILERLSAALERELNRQRKGYRRKPPIGLKDAMRTSSNGTEHAQKTTAEGEARVKTQRNLENAAESGP